MRLVAVLVAGLFTVMPVSLAVAAEIPRADSPEGRNEELLDEVLVQGTRLWRLRQQMVQLEDGFYALYNELNKNKDFEVHCHIEVPPDRIIKERVCRLAFVENAQEVEVKALVDGHSAPPADMVHQARSMEFERNFLQVVNSEPRLLQMVRKREALEKKYDEERKQRSGNHRWFRFEK